MRGRPPTPVDPALFGYLSRLAVAEDPLVEELAEETHRNLPEQASMQVGPDQGKLLYLLVKLTGARTVLEVGTFTGMSALWMARALPDDGRLICCDVSPEWTAVARRYWERAGVAHRIELRLGPAVDTLAGLPPDPHLDLVFIDADKANYPTYLEMVVPRLRPGGLLLADNVLWSGRIIDLNDHTDDTEALRRFNRLVAQHPELESVILTVGDGVTLARKR